MRRRVRRSHAGGGRSGRRESPVSAAWAPGVGQPGHRPAGGVLPPRRPGGGRGGDPRQPGRCRGGAASPPHLTTDCALPPSVHGAPCSTACVLPSSIGGVVRRERQAFLLSARRPACNGGGRTLLAAFKSSVCVGIGGVRPACPCAGGAGCVRLVCWRRAAGGLSPLASVSTVYWRLLLRTRGPRPASLRRSGSVLCLHRH